LSHSKVVQALRNADLANVRDTKTAELMNRPGVDITACPTLMLLRCYEGTRKERFSSSHRVVYTPHSELVSLSNKIILRECLKGKYSKVFVTENMQRPWRGLWDLIEKYNSASLVVTSRLHGAIIAWSLGVPFLGFSRDQKLDGFRDLVGLHDNMFRNLED